MKSSQSEEVNIIRQTWCSASEERPVGYEASWRTKTVSRCRSRKLSWVTIHVVWSPSPSAVWTTIISSVAISELYGDIRFWSFPSCESQRRTTGSLWVSLLKTKVAASPQGVTCKHDYSRSRLLVPLFGGNRRSQLLRAVEQQWAWWTWSFSCDTCFTTTQSTCSAWGFVSRLLYNNQQTTHVH